MGSCPLPLLASGGWTETTPRIARLLWGSEPAWRGASGGPGGRGQQKLSAGGVYRGSSSSLCTERWPTLPPSRSLWPPGLARQHGTPSLVRRDGGGSCVHSANPKPPLC